MDVKHNQPDNKKVNKNPSHPQEIKPIALFKGTFFKKMPDDLYIPPEALSIFLESFEGPLDLLLYLIKRNNTDILDICIAKVTQQYMSYIELMEVNKFELAAEYLVMAATLAEIKSRMLLPRSKDLDTEEEDPRARLIQRLQEYASFKEAANTIDKLPRMGRDYQYVRACIPKLDAIVLQPKVTCEALVLALQQIMQRAHHIENHQIQRETLSVKARMSHVLSLLSVEGFTPFVALFHPEEGKQGIIVTFMAVMELSKARLIELIQTVPYSPIHLKACE